MGVTLGAHIGLPIGTATAAAATTTGTFGACTMNELPAPTPAAGSAPSSLPVRHHHGNGVAPGYEPGGQVTDTVC
jgi:hypothetical protein